MTLPRIGGFDAPAGSDYAGMTYDGDNLITVTYRQGGAEGGVTGVLNITYDGTKITAVYWS
jgi:hypothetical protein